jgi:hypothetical protein
VYDLEFLIKWCKLIPEIRFTAADAGMTRLNRPAGSVVELGHGAIVIRFRSPAAHLKEAVTQLGLFGTEFFYELIIFKVSPSRTLVMNGFPVGKQGPTEIVEGR